MKENILKEVEKETKKRARKANTRSGFIYTYKRI